MRPEQGRRSRRVADWTARLHAVIEAASVRPFAWGAHDCCVFAADCVRAITGSDPMAELRGAYDDARGAARLLAERDLRGRLLDALGYPIPVALAQRGDVVIVTHLRIVREGVVLLDETAEGREAAGICLGEKSAFAAESGLAMLPTLACAAAWRV